MEFYSDWQRLNDTICPLDFETNGQINSSTVSFQLSRNGEKEKKKDNEMLVFCSTSY
jgi:hypothetical protein